MEFMYVCHNLWQVLERMPMPLFSKQRAHAARLGFSKEWLYVLPFSKGRFEHAYVHMSLLSTCTVLYACLATDDSQRPGSLRRRRRRRRRRRQTFVTRNNSDRRMCQTVGGCHSHTPPPD